MGSKTVTLREIALTFGEISLTFGCWGVVRDSSGKPLLDKLKSKWIPEPILRWSPGSIWVLQGTERFERE